MQTTQKYDPRCNFVDEKSSGDAYTCLHEVHGNFLPFHCITQRVEMGVNF